MAYNPELPWNDFPCRDWPKGFSVPKGTVDFGYGIVNIGSKQFRVTRVVFEKAVRKLAQGESVLHRCDRPICFEANHLFGGVAADNVRDCINKGRKPLGENSVRAILTEAQVREILAASMLPGFSQADTGRKYGVTGSLIWRIVHRKLWCHLGI